MRNLSLCPGYLVGFLTMLLAAFPATAEQSFTLADNQATTRLKTEPVQWLSESVTVIKRNELDATYRRDIEYLEGYAPGLIVDRNLRTPGGAVLAIRGIGSSEITKNFSPAVATYVDDVYIGTHTGTLVSLFDVEQVEVARGPQLFRGAPAMAGSIAYTRSRPTGEFDFNVRAAAASYGRTEASGVLNLPQFGGFKTKITFDLGDGGGEYMDNLIVPRDENTEDTTAFGLSFLWEVNDSIEAQYTYDNLADDWTTPALLNLSDGDDLMCANSTNEENCRSSLGPGVPQLLSLDLTAQNYGNEREFEADSHTLRITAAFSGMELRSITGIRGTSERIQTDFDASQVDYYSQELDNEYDQTSQELTLTGQFSERLDFAVGYYYLDTDYTVAQLERFVAWRLTDNGLAPGYLPGDDIRLDSSTAITMHSVFGHLQYQLTDQWTFDAGARVYDIDKDFTHRPLGLVRAGANTASPVDLRLAASFTEYSYTAGATFKVDEEAMLYLRYSQAMRPGGFDENAISTEFAEFDAEVSSSLELGIKSEWYNDHLRLNAAYFQNKHRDKLEPYVAQPEPGRREWVLDNIARIDNRGVEVEFEWLPLTNLYVRGSYTHLSSGYEQYLVPDWSTDELVDRAGYTTNWSPADTLFIASRYSIDLWRGVLDFYAGYKVVDNYATNNQLVIGDVLRRSTWDLSLDYTWNDVTVRVFAHNTNDKRFLQNAYRVGAGDFVPLSPTASESTPLITGSEYNVPRIAGIELRYRFSQ